MLPKIMHHCAFLIITFSSYILCIQNGKSVFSSSPVDKLLERRYISSSEAGQPAFHQNDFDSSGGFRPSTGVPGFRFPDKHQYNTNSSPNELLPSFKYRNPYPNNREVANSNQGANPYNLALNTGEHSADANNPNNYPYQQNANAFSGYGQRNSHNVPNANDFYLSQQQSPSSAQYQHLNSRNPYYPTPSPSYQGYQPIQQKPTYAQDFGNYLYNGQPNYKRRPTPPPRPPPPSGPESSYSPYQDGHLTGPYRYGDLTSPSSSSVSTRPSTYPPQYANQFGNFGNGGGGFGTTSPANPLTSLLNSFRGPFAGTNPLSMQIIQGLEKIARNDDLECVPKVLCQALGSPTRRAQFPSFITSPVLTRFVEALPSFSPALIYGRAALLGLSGGEYSCTTTYKKCPEEENEILFYLNNHRGGFFKFFSQPDDIENDDVQQYTSQPSSTPSYEQQQQQSSQPSIFNFLTGLGPTSSTTNTNQGNMNSFMSNAVTKGIGSLFGNIISGFLGGGQVATRRNDDDNVDDDESPEKYSDLIESNSTTTEPEEEQIEGRILNNKSNILAYAEPVHDNPISFPLESENDNYETQQFQSEFRFPNAPLRDTSIQDEDSGGGDDYRRGKKVNFIDTKDVSRPLYGTQMIFPDRTGTGNLRFDNDEFFRVGKILNRPSGYVRDFRQQESYSDGTTTTTRRPTNYYTKPSYSSNSGIPNRYASSNYFRQDYGQNQNQNQENKEDTTGNVYVTNAQGVIEYYINSNGKKVYV